MMLGSRLRTVAGTGLVVAAALFMTACGPEEDSAADASPTASASASQGADEGAGESGGAAAASGGSSDGGTTTGGSADGGSADDGGSSDGGSANGGADGASSGGTGGGDDGAGARTASGELTYLAPGKYLVGDQAFWVAEDTEVWGAGGLCGDGEGQVAAECTADQLEDAAKRGGTEVTVEMTDGVATTVREGSDG